MHYICTCHTLTNIPQARLLFRFLFVSTWMWASANSETLIDVNLLNCYTLRKVETYQFPEVLANTDSEVVMSRTLAFTGSLPGSGGTVWTQAIKSDVLFNICTILKSVVFIIFLLAVFMHFIKWLCNVHCQAIWKNTRGEIWKIYHSSHQVLCVLNLINIYYLIVLVPSYFLSTCISK